MGVFSYTCAKTNLPYLNSKKFAKHAFAQAVVLRPGAPAEDAPSDLRTLYPDLESGSAKLVLKAYYDPAADTYESVGFSKSDPGQGHFYNSPFLKKLEKVGPFASYEGYHLAYALMVPMDEAARMSREKAETIQVARHVLADAVKEARIRSLVPDVLPVAKVQPYHFIGVKFERQTLYVTANSPDGMSERTVAKVSVDSDGKVSPGFEEVAAQIVRENPLVQVLDVTLVRDGKDVAHVTRHDTGAGERLFIVADPQTASRLLFADSRSLMSYYEIDQNNYLVSAQLDNFQPQTVADRIDIGVMPDFGFGSDDEEEANSLKP